MTKSPYLMGIKPHFPIYIEAECDGCRQDFVLKIETPGQKKRVLRVVLGKDQERLLCPVCRDSAPVESAGKKAS